MEERASGIILRTRPLTETSVIVQWLTREHGRISTVAKGARRPKSPFAGKLDIFYEADFSFARSRKSELHTLREISVLRSNARLREDLSRLHAAAYTAVLLEQGTERETPLPDQYGLILEVLEKMLVQFGHLSGGNKVERELVPGESEKILDQGGRNYPEQPCINDALALAISKLKLLHLSISRDALRTRR